MTNKDRADSTETDGTTMIDKTGAKSDLHLLAAAVNCPVDGGHEDDSTISVTKSTLSDIDTVSLNSHNGKCSPDVCGTPENGTETMLSNGDGVLHDHHDNGSEVELNSTMTSSPTDTTAAVDAPSPVSTPPPVCRCVQQTVLVSRLRTCLDEQETTSRRLLLAKDEQLKKITAGLLLLESQLRRQTEHLTRLLADRERRLADQESGMQALLRLNRKMAARLQRQAEAKEEDARRAEKRRRKSRRISWHNEVFVISAHGDRDRLTTTTLNDKDENNRRNAVAEVVVTEEEEEGDEDTTTSRNGVDDEEDEDSMVDQACDAVDQALEETSDTDSAAEEDVDSRPSGWRSAGNIRSATPTLRHQHSVPSCGGSHGNPSSPHGAACLIRRDGEGNVQGGDPPNLGVVYNRVMSNHRSVTKPKDVKYKKISRVKSRSLEELRGRLKKHLLHQPAVFLDSPVLLEQGEEIV